MTPDQRASMVCRLVERLGTMPEWPPRDVREIAGFDPLSVPSIRRRHFSIPGDRIGCVAVNSADTLNHVRTLL